MRVMTLSSLREMPSGVSLAWRRTTRLSLAPPGQGLGSGLGLGLGLGLGCLAPPVGGLAAGLPPALASAALPPLPPGHASPGARWRSVSTTWVGLLSSSVRRGLPSSGSPAQAQWPVARVRARGKVRMWPRR